MNGQGHWLDSDTRSYIICIWKHGSDMLFAPCWSRTEAIRVITANQKASSTPLTHPIGGPWSSGPGLHLAKLAKSQGSGRWGSSASPRMWCSWMSLAICYSVLFCFTFAIVGVLCLHFFQVTLSSCLPSDQRLCFYFVFLVEKVLEGLPTSVQRSMPSKTLRRSSQSHEKPTDLGGQATHQSKHEWLSNALMLYLIMSFEA